MLLAPILWVIILFVLIVYGEKNSHAQSIEKNGTLYYDVLSVLSMSNPIFPPPPL